MTSGWRGVWLVPPPPSPPASQFVPVMDIPAAPLWGTNAGAAWRRVEEVLQRPPPLTGLLPYCVQRAQQGLPLTLRAAKPCGHVVECGRKGLKKCMSKEGKNPEGGVPRQRGRILYSRPGPTKASRGRRFQRMFNDSDLGQQQQRRHQYSPVAELCYAAALGHLGRGRHTRAAAAEPTCPLGRVR